jgi:hypothetical protein
MDANGSLEIRIGRLEGRFGAIEVKVDAMDKKLDRALAWMSERTGAEQENARIERRGQVSRHTRATLLAGGVSGLVSLIVSVIAAKFHWASP